MEEANWFNKKRSTYLLTGLIIVGAGMRLYGLSVQSLWWDELVSWLFSSRDTLGEVLQEVGRDVHPPLHSILLYFVEQYLGDSEFWLRLPSAIFGVLAIPSMYLLGKRLFGRQAGIWAAILTTTLMFPIYYSQEARDYALLFLFCVLGMFFWIPILRAQVVPDEIKPFSKTGCLLYGLVSVATIYTHHYGSIMVALQGLGLILAGQLSPKKALRVIGLYLPIVGLSIPIWMQAIGQYHGNTLTWLSDPSFDLFTATYYTFFNRSELVKNLALVICLVPLFRLCVKSIKQRDASQFGLRRSLEIWVLVFWLVLPFCVGSLGTLLLKPMITIRYLIVSAPAAYLLLARGISVISKRVSIQHALGIFFTLVALVDLFAIKQYYWTPKKDQWRETAAQIIKVNKQPDRNLMIGCVWRPAFVNYYFERLGSELRLSIEASRQTDFPNLRKAIQAKKPDTIWFVRIHRPLDQKLLELLQKNYRETSHVKFINADIWSFVRPET